LARPSAVQLANELLGAVFDDQAIEHGLHDALIIRRQIGNRFEQQRKPGVLRSALVGLEDQLVERDVQGQGDLFQTIERGLGAAALVAADLVDVQAGEFGELGLGQALGFAQAQQVGGDAHAEAAELSGAHEAKPRVLSGFDKATCRGITIQPRKGIDARPAEVGLCPASPIPSWTG
jgi:hypothetical protein